MQTEKLYLNDSLLMQFKARVTDITEFEGKPALTLDQTAFYPLGGGQLGDRGQLEINGQNLTVIDTRIDQGLIHHLLDSSVSDELKDSEVSGVIDETHRRDMMSQHTGQHLLSSAFYKITGLETISARLGGEDSTIDLETERLSDDVIAQVEDMVNDLVLRDLPVQPIYPDATELANLPLRRQSKVTKNIRLIQVGDFDLTPCGGTHCHRTGQIGSVRIVSQEKYKSMTRFHFLCGKRALKYFRDGDLVLADLCRQVGVGPNDLADSINRRNKDIKDLSGQLGKTRAELIGYLAEHLHAQHPATDSGFTPIVTVREHDDAQSIRKLASALVNRPDVVALVAARDPKSDGWAVVIERGADVDLHIGNWFRDRSKELGGRGGGRPERAEGRWPAQVDWKSFQF